MLLNGRVSKPKIRPTNQCTRIAKRRLIEIGWACGGTMALKVTLLTRNRMISSIARCRFAATGNGAADVSAALRQSIVGGLARGPANNGLTVKNER
jgi:hypothetical protein